MTSSSAGRDGPMRDPDSAAADAPVASGSADAPAQNTTSTATAAEPTSVAAAAPEVPSATATITSTSTTTATTTTNPTPTPSTQSIEQPSQTSQRIPPAPSTPPPQSSRQSPTRTTQSHSDNKPNDNLTMTDGLERKESSPTKAAPALETLPPTQSVEVDHHMSDAPAGNSNGDSAAGNNARPDAATDAVAAPITNSESMPKQATPMQVQMPTNANMPVSEQFPPSTPFTPTPMSSLNQHAYMMMALASMSGAPSAMSPPPTVTPSQVTLPNSLDHAFSNLNSTNALRAHADKSLESFARIEFADSVFQITTYAVIIGRDQRALEQARRDEKREGEYQRRVEENASKGLPPPSPPVVQDRSKFSKSYVSEEGGMLGPESDSEGSGRPTKRRKTSTNGSSENKNDESQENMISNRQYVSHTPGAAAVDLASLRPSPWHVPFVGIHSPGPNIASKTKAISREHLKIAYNQRENVFEAIPLHKNGFFCEDVHYKQDKVVLKCGDRLQIKDIDFRFMINGVERGCTGAEEFQEEEEVKAAAKKRSTSGKEMSFDFESAHGNADMADTSDELSDVDMSAVDLSDFDNDDDEEEEEEEEEDEEAAEDEAEEGAEGEAEAEAEAEADAELDNDAEAEEAEEAAEAEADGDISAEEIIDDDDSGVKHESQPDLHLLMPQIPKKRGPGRPPKNGIMSKREQRLLKKQQQEMAKKTLPQAPPIEPPIKRKVGRPRKHPLPDDGGDRPEKRKYKPRKPKDSEGPEGSDAERRAREKKEKKVRPKSPPLELKIEDYTEEQLQKPNKNYGVLIDETLSAAPDGLILKQIYKRICQRYPWFYFHTETKGWESSVRHNLIGNEAFKKDETTNLWSRVPGVELDAGKKRKASSPDRNLAAQAYGPYSYPYNAGQHMAPGAPGYPHGQAPPGYQVAGYNAQQGQLHRPMQPYGASASPPVPSPAVANQPPAPAQLPPGYGPPPAPARPQLGRPQPGAYSSPYASRPPPPANPQIKREDGHSLPAPAPVQLPQTLATGAKTIGGPVPAPQQAPAPNSRPPAASPPSAPPRPVIDPRLLQAVVGLKNGLVENLKKARNPKAEAIVMSALNRCIGLKKEATENEKMEAICMKGIRQVIDGYAKNKSPTPGGSGSLPPSDISPIFEPKVLTSLNGFRDISVKTLKAKLGEGKAEAVTLSAMDRVLGLADASIVAPPAEGEQPSAGNLEGVEQHLIKSIRQLLTGMNQKLQGAAAS